MTCTPLYDAAERAYAFLSMQRQYELTPELKTILNDLHDALRLDEEPSPAWWKEEMRDRAERKE